MQYHQKMFGLINAMLREFLGKYGIKLLDVLLSNSLIVCTIVIFYGVLLVFAQGNMEKIGKKAKNLETGDILPGKDPASILAAKKPEFWEQLQEGIRFPFISLPSSFLLYRITQANMNKLLIRYFLSQQRQMKIKKP